MQTYRNRCQQGFTLIELSIVLVIIGLLVGGVLVGQDMIKAAQVRSTITQIDKVNTAVNVFQDKFGGLPGDLSGNGFSSSQGTGGTPNVLGNGAVESCTANNGVLLGCENLAFWNHLSQAGLIDGSYTTSGYTSASTFANATALAAAMPTTRAGKGNFLHVQFGNGNNNYRIAAITAVNAGTITAGGGLSPVTAANIDAKLDDGAALTGSVLARDDAVSGAAATMTDNAATAAGSNRCVSSASGTYNQADTNLLCQLRIQASF